MPVVCGPSIKGITGCRSHNRSRGIWVDGDRTAGAGAAITVIIHRHSHRVIVFRRRYINMTAGQTNGGRAIAGVVIFSSCQVTVCASSQLLVETRLLPPLTDTSSPLCGQHSPSHLRRAERTTPR